MVSDQEVFSQEEVQLGSGEHAIFTAVIHGMDDDEEIRGELVLFLGGVFVHFG